MKASRKLKKWREENGHTQRAAAAKAGISQAAWQSIESGQAKRVGVHTATRIVQATEGQVTIEDLVAMARAS